MKRFIKLYWLPVIVMFVIFFAELFNCIAIVQGFSVESGMKQYEAMSLAAIGYSMMIFDFLKGRIGKREHRVLVVLFAMLFLYMLTSLFYGGSSEKHTTYLLLFGSECIPAAYIGIRFAKSSSFNRINDLLPFIVIPLSTLIGSIGLAAAMMGTTLNRNSGIGVEAGLNYNLLSYYMAFSYTYAFYYVFYGCRKSGMIAILLRIIMAIDMLYCAAICLLGGGRGAFIYIVAITFFMLFYFLKSSRNHRLYAFFIVVLLTIAVLYIIKSFDILHSAGMERISNKLTEDNARSNLYQIAFDTFLSSPVIGMGIGSIWWTVGYYCHNMILDLMAETGLVGTFIFLRVIWISMIKLYRLSYSDKIYFFLLLVIAGDLISNMFSGYYIAAFKIYFVCSLVYCIPKKVSYPASKVVGHKTLGNEK